MYKDCYKPMVQGSIKAENVEGDDDYVENDPPVTFD